MKKNKTMCSGCRDDFYNGHNPLNVKECWGFATAKVVTRVQVGTWQPPPYTWIPQDVLSCYHREGSAFLKRDDCRVVEPKKEKARP
jgi:hypothetical protein